MKKTKIIYWIFTGLLAGLMIFSGIPDMLRVDDAVKLITTHLGYPVYFLTFIGVAKLLGGIAILIPGFPRIKEWAYAGISFDMIAATYSQIAVGDSPKGWGFMFIFLGLLAGSYIYYHKKLAEASSNNM